MVSSVLLPSRIYTSSKSLTLSRQRRKFLPEFKVRIEMEQGILFIYSDCVLPPRLLEHQTFLKILPECLHTPSTLRTRRREPARERPARLPRSRLLRAGGCIAFRASNRRRCG